MRSVFGDVGMRAFKIRVVRSRLGVFGVRSFKIGVVCDRVWGSWGAIAKRSVGIV